MAKFENIKVSDFAELIHTVTQRDIDKFVDLTGDNNKLHVDAQYAEGTSYKKPVAHGMLGASFISTVIGTKLPGDGALWFSQSLEFLLPVRIGDQITVRAEVLKKTEASKTIELKTEIFNQHRQVVTSGLAKVKVVEQEEQSAPQTSKEIRKRVALVIGGSGGIGSAVCRKLANDGFRVAINYRSNEAGAAKVREELIASDHEAALFCADIVNEKQVKEMTENVLRQFENIDVLVNCSTVKVPAIKLSSVLWEDLESHLNINIRGNFNLMKYIVPVMEKIGRGKIVNLTTQYIENSPPPQMLSYVTAKSALHGFSKALAVELAPKGITVNLVSPGMTDTELISDVPEKMKLLTAAKAPLRRLAHPDDVANAISFLVSEKSDYITGETIRVNGGQVMQ